MSRSRIPHTDQSPVHSPSRWTCARKSPFPGYWLSRFDLRNQDVACPLSPSVEAPHHRNLISVTVCDSTRPSSNAPRLLPNAHASTRDDPGRCTLSPEVMAQDRPACIAVCLRCSTTAHRQSRHRALIVKHVISDCGAEQIRSPPSSMQPPACVSGFSSEMLTIKNPFHAFHMAAPSPEFVPHHLGYTYAAVLSSEEYKPPAGACQCSTMRIKYLPPELRTVSRLSRGYKPPSPAALLTPPPAPTRQSARR